MNILSKRTVLDADDDLFRKAHPVLLHIFSLGVAATQSKQLMRVALFSIALSPIGWVMAVIYKAIHVAILLVAWWFLKDLLAEYAPLDVLLLVLGLIAIFYQDIYVTLLTLVLNVFILMTAGGFLRWVCSGYLSGAPVRHKFMTTKPFERIIGATTAFIPLRYRNQYDEIMDLYLESNDPANEEKLLLLLEEYTH